MIFCNLKFFFEILFQRKSWFSSKIDQQMYVNLWLDSLRRHGMSVIVYESISRIEISVVMKKS